MFPLPPVATPPDVITTVYPEEVGSLLGHPDVYQLETAPAAACDRRELVTLALWVREIADPDYDRVLKARRERGYRRPERAPDMEFSGEALPPPGFFDRLPDLATYAMIYEPYWAAKIWLRSPLAAR